jgi:hypothetical protein
MSDVLDFNRQIELLLDAGVPIVIGELSTPAEIRSFLKSVSNPNSETVGSIHDSCYRQALTRWLESNKSADAFDGFHRLGVAKKTAKYALFEAILPSVLLCIVLVPALQLMIFQVYPSITKLYIVSEVKPSSRMQQLLDLSTWLFGPVPWLIPIAFLLVYLWGPSAVARLLPRALRLPHLSTRQSTTETKSPVALNSIKTLAWQSRLQDQHNVWIRWIPLVCSSFVGGLLVVSYAFLVFWPLVHLLHRLSVHSGVLQP